MYPPPAPPPAQRRSHVGLIVGLSAAALVVVIVVGAIVGVILARPGAEEEKPAATTVLGAGSGVQITPRELSDMAQARGTAVRNNDLKAFLKNVDPSATKLRAAQQSLFKNLRKVKFSRVDYRPFDQQGRSLDRFGRSVRLNVDVAFVHQIDGYDAAPVEEWYRWTVVKKDASSPLVITAVAASPPERVGESQSVMYPAPWDVWPDMQIVQTEHTMFLVDKPMAAKTRRYAPVAEKAARTVLASWRDAGGGTGVFDRFVSTLVPDNDGLRDIYQVIKGEATEAGRMMPMSIDGNDDRTGGTRSVFDASSSFFRDGNADEIFRHEYAHAMIEALQTNDHPDAGLYAWEPWVIEGFAEYVANLGGSTAGIRDANGAARVRRGFDGKIPGASAWQFSAGATRNFYYFLAHQAFRHMDAKYGEAKAFAFAAAYYRGGKSMDQIMQDVFGAGFATFQRDWATFVRADAR